MISSVTDVQKSLVGTSVDLLESDLDLLCEDKKDVVDYLRLNGTWYLKEYLMGGVTYTTCPCPLTNIALKRFNVWELDAALVADLVVAKMEGRIRDGLILHGDGKHDDEAALKNWVNGVPVFTAGGELLENGIDGLKLWLPNQVNGINLKTSGRPLSIKNCIFSMQPDKPL